MRSTIRRGDRRVVGDDAATQVSGGRNCGEEEDSHDQKATRKMLSARRPREGRARALAVADVVRKIER